MRVLVVDDSEHILAMVREMLPDEGYTTLDALNGQEAVDLLKSGEKVDVVLLDWNMPVMDGPTFLEAVRDEKLTDAPILMMTTENKIEKITKAISLGASEYIMKPFTEDILVSKIDFALKQAA